jgi:phospholipid/cholesterol/gamma-HCH transport system substrate-binding protein
VTLSKEVKIGFIVVLAVFLFIYGLNFLKGKNIFRSRIRYYALFENVGGLTESNPVYYHGFVIGKVNKIAISENQPDKILVDFVLSENDVKIPKNSIAKIFSDGLLGTKAIEIVFGDSKEYAETGDTLAPQLENSLTDELAIQLQPVKTKAEALIVSIDSLVKSVNNIFTPNTNKGLTHSLENIEQITNNANGMVVELRSRLGAITGNLESISKNLKDNNQTISAVLSNFKNITDTLVKADLAKTINNAYLTLKEASEIMAKINSGKGTLGLLVNNDSLYNNLEVTSRDLDKLIVDLKEHPKRYVHLSIFGKSDKPEKKKK